MIIDTYTQSSASFLPYYHLLYQLDDGLSAVTYHITVHGEIHMFCNDRFSEMFMTADEMTAKIKEFNVIPTVLWSR